MTCPNCKCLECRAASHEAMKAALSKIVSRETISSEQHNKAVLSNIEEREQWWDTFIGTDITFRVGDDFRALSTDHAADLANAGLADELQRGCG